MLILYKLLIALNVYYRRYISTIPVLAYFKISFTLSVIHLSIFGSEKLHKFGTYLAEIVKIKK